MKSIMKAEVLKPNNIPHKISTSLNAIIHSSKQEQKHEEQVRPREIKDWRAITRQGADCIR